MEKTFKGIKHYYKELQMFEKSISNNSSNFRKWDKPKTFLKNKSELPIRIDKKRTESQKNARLSLHPQASVEVTISQANDRPVKYLEDLSQSHIDANCGDSSSISKEQNHKIILEINQTEPSQNMKDLNHKLGKASSMPRLLKGDLQIKESKFLKLKTGQAKIDDQKKTEGLLKELKLRNRVYELLKSNLKEKVNNEVQQFEKIWRQYTIYQKCMDKIANTNIKL